MHRDITRQYRVCIFLMFFTAFLVMVQGPLFVSSDGLTLEEVTRFKSNPREEEIRHLTKTLTSDEEFPIHAEQALLKAQQNRLREVENQVLARLEDSSTNLNVVESSLPSEPTQPEVESGAKRAVVFYDGLEATEVEIDISEQGLDATASVVTPQSKSTTQDLPLAQPKEQLPSLNQDQEISIAQIDSLRREFQTIRQRINLQEDLLRSIDQSLVEIAHERDLERAGLSLKTLSTPEIASLNLIPQIEAIESTNEVARARTGAKPSVTPTDHGYANINTKRAYVYTGPAQFDSIIFSLYEGTKVKVLETRGEWARVATPSGVKGWVKGKYLG